MRERGPYQNTQYRRFLDPNYNPKDDPNSPDYEPDYITRTTRENRHHGQVHGDSWVTQEPVTRQQLTESGRRRQAALRRAERASDLATLEDLDRQLEALDTRMRTEVLAHRKPKEAPRSLADNPYMNLDAISLRDEIQRVQRELRNVARIEDAKPLSLLTRNRFFKRETNREQELITRLNLLQAAQQAHKNKSIDAEYEHRLNQRAQEIEDERRRLHDQANHARLRSGRPRY